MKLSSAAILCFIGGASAFAPSSPMTPTSVLRMSEVADAVGVAETVEIPETKSELAPVADAGEVAVTKNALVPLPIGAIPTLGDKTYFVGENYWNKLTSDYGSEATGTYLRAAEIKHGRSAMVATVGFCFHKFGWTLNNISPHEYLSPTLGVKFADLAAMTPLEAMKNVPAQGLTQMFAFIALFEIYELSHKDGKIVEDARVAPGLEPGGLTGDIGWNPLNVDINDRRRLVEIQNGRAAMFAICAWIAHDAIAGSVPLILPWK